MRTTYVLLAIGLGLMSCNRHDTRRGEPAARQVGREAHEASRELKREAKEAAQEIRKAGKEFREGWNEGKRQAPPKSDRK